MFPGNDFLDAQEFVVAMLSREARLKRRIKRWEDCNKDWMSTVLHKLPPPDPVDSADEAYLLSALIPPRLQINDLVRLLLPMSQQERRHTVSEAYASGRRGFTQLAVKRLLALTRQQRAQKHPQDFEQSNRFRWQDLGYESGSSPVDQGKGSVQCPPRPPTPKRTRSIIFAGEPQSESRSEREFDNEPVMTRKIPPRTPLITGQQPPQKTGPRPFVLPPTFHADESDPEAEVDIPLPASLETPPGNLTHMLHGMIQQQKVFSRKLRAGPAAHWLDPLPASLDSRTDRRGSVKDDVRRNDSHTPGSSPRQGSTPDAADGLRATVLEEAKPIRSESEQPAIMQRHG